MRPEDQLQGQPIQAVGAPTETVRDQDKIMLVLAYLGIFSLIPLLTVKDSPFVAWHARQGLIWGVGGSVVLALLSTIFGWIPWIGWIFACVAWVAWLGVDMLAMVKALNGERWRIPFASDLADKM